ncbi:hypothetical protein D3C71_1230390 [compost metagenome]
MFSGKLCRRRQVPVGDQHVVDVALPLQHLHAAPHFRPRQPGVRLRFILHQMTQATQQRLLPPFIKPLRQLRRSDVQPAHYPADATALLHLCQQFLCFLLAVAGLHHQRTVKTVALQQRIKLRRTKVLLQHRHLLADPRVALRMVLPVMLVGIDAQHGLFPVQPRNRYCSSDDACISIE